MELKSLSHTHTQLLVDALTTLGLLRCYGLEFGSPKVGTAGSGDFLCLKFGLLSPERVRRGSAAPSINACWPYFAMQATSRGINHHPNNIPWHQPSSKPHDVTTIIQATSRDNHHPSHIT
ncbi:hypothetical protein ACOMHN_059337 [Nucella lapillus]